MNADDQGRPCTLDGVEFHEAFRRLKDAGADVVGFNCTRGPEELIKLVEGAVNAGIKVKFERISVKIWGKLKNWGNNKQEIRYFREIRMTLVFF